MVEEEISVDEKRMSRKEEQKRLVLVGWKRIGKKESKKAREKI